MLNVYLYVFVFLGSCQPCCPAHASFVRYYLRVSTTLLMSAEYIWKSNGPST